MCNYTKCLLRGLQYQRIGRDTSKVLFDIFAIKRVIISKIEIYLPYIVHVE